MSTQSAAVGKGICCELVRSAIRVIFAFPPAVAGTWAASWVHTRRGPETPRERTIGRFSYHCNDMLDTVLNEPLGMSMPPQLRPATAYCETV